MDMSAGDFRWLTVAPPGTATQIVLYKDVNATHDDHAGLVFHSADINATYEQLSSRGVATLRPAEGITRDLLPSSRPAPP